MSVVKIASKKITQFETKQIPTIEQENKIFKKDNIGTVVPGDALRNINLSTVPSVVQDAINAMGLSVETNILANALIMQIQRDLDNVGDAIVEKSYIDGQVSYLTSLLGQKSDTGDVASIVDSRIAIVTEDFATTAQVNNLNSRVGESESSITTLNQTINTKDAARATQIEEVEARVNQSLSNYTAVLNLTVDENGNVISQKIESLVAQNARANISIDENNKITLDENGNFTAYVAKFINDGHGNIVGFSFTDSDDAQSVFGINADVFQVSDATNRYTPFRIEDNNIYFNGKVTFSSIFSTDEEWQQQVQSAIDNNATTIDGGKIVTNQAFVSNLNAVGGVVADTITGNELNGVVINGARINGAVIKASYLDLDGELEVLTNYHITPAMYNANPSLYTDAVYISGSNEYRIPSISTVRESNTTIDIPLGSSEYNSLIHSYSMATAGNNIKAVRINPQVLVSSDINLVDISFIPAYYDQFGSRQGPWLNKNSFYDINVKVAGNTCAFRFYTGGYDRASNNNLGPAYYAGVTAYMNGSYVISYPIKASTYTDSRYDYNTNITIGGLLFNVSTKNTYGTGGPAEEFGLAISTSFRLKLISGSYQLPNWSNNESLIRVITSNITNPGTLTSNQYPGEGNAFAYKHINNSTAISINNMI